MRVNVGSDCLVAIAETPSLRGNRQVCLASLKSHRGEGVVVFVLDVVLCVEGLTVDK